MKITRRRAVEYATDTSEADHIRFVAARGNAAFTIDVSTCPERIPAYGHWRPENSTCKHAEEPSRA